MQQHAPGAARPQPGKEAGVGQRIGHRLHQRVLLPLQATHRRPAGITGVPSHGAHMQALPLGGGCARPAACCRSHAGLAARRLPLLLLLCLRLLPAQHSSAQGIAAVAPPACRQLVLVAGAAGGATGVAVPHPPLPGGGVKHPAADVLAAGAAAAVGHAAIDGVPDWLAGPGSVAC